MSYDENRISDLIDAGIMKDQEIKSEKINPPIGIRDKDYRAWRGDLDDTSLIGYGETRREAVQELVIIELEKAQDTKEMFAVWVLNYENNQTTFVSIWSLENDANSHAEKLNKIEFSNLKYYVSSVSVNPFDYL